MGALLRARPAEGRGSPSGRGARPVRKSWRTSQVIALLSDSPARAAQVGDADGAAPVDSANGGWKTNGGTSGGTYGGVPLGKLDAEAPLAGAGVLNVAAAEERLRHQYAPGKRTWFFWVIIILAANGGLLLGAAPPRQRRLCVRIIMEKS